MVLLLIYCIAGYWAANKVMYEGKVVIYSDWLNLFMKKLVYGVVLGWLFIPIALIKCLLSR